MLGSMAKGIRIVDKQDLALLSQSRSAQRPKYKHLTHSISKKKRKYSKQLMRRELRVVADQDTPTWLPIERLPSEFLMFCVLEPDVR